MPRRFFVWRVETTSSSEVIHDIVQSFVEYDSSNTLEHKSRIEKRKHFFKKENENKQDQLLSKAKQKQEVCYIVITCIHSCACN